MRKKQLNASNALKDSSEIQIEQRWVSSIMKRPRAVFIQNRHLCSGFHLGPDGLQKIKQLLGRYSPLLPATDLLSLWR